MRLRRVISSVILAAFVATGCQVDATTTVTVDDDGSGLVAVEVVLDREAFLRADDLSRQLRTDDLIATGWEIVGPEPTEDQGRRILATKPFADPDQAASILEEITGPDGPLQAADVERSKQFGRVEQQFSAVLDLSGGIEAFSDADLTALLNDLPIGQDVAALEEELGAPLAELTSFTLVVDLPVGDVSTQGDPAIVETDERRTFTWEGALGDAPVDLRARTREVDWLVLGLAAAALLTGLILAGILGRRLAQRRRPTTVAAPPAP